MTLQEQRRACALWCDALDQWRVLHHREELAPRDRHAFAAAVRSRVFHLQASMERVDLFCRRKLERRANELDRDFVRAAPEMPACRVALILRGPSVTEKHPGARASLERNAPFETIDGTAIGLLVAGHRRAGPELVFTVFIYQQRAGPGRVESLRATEHRAARVLDEKAVAHAHELALRRCDCGAERRQHGGNWRVDTIVQWSESVQRAGDVAPDEAAAVSLVLGDEPRAEQTE